MCIKRLLPILILLSLVCGGCKRNEQITNPRLPTILQYIGASPNLSYLSAAISRANSHTMPALNVNFTGQVNLATIFATGGPFTIFAPTNAAFIKAGFTLDAINTARTSFLDSLIRYIVLPGKIDSSSIIGNFDQRALSLLDGQTYRPTITQRFSFGVFIDGKRAELGFITLSDGTLQITNDLTEFPRSNLYNLIKENPKVSFMATLLDSISSLDLITHLDTITMIIPTDSAFRLLGYQTVHDLLKVDTGTLLSNYIVGTVDGLYRYSVPPQGGTRFFTSQWFGGFHSGSLYYPNQNSTGFSISVDGMYLTKSSNLTPPLIVYPNIVATNGVLHIMDQVYLNGDGGGNTSLN